MSVSNREIKIPEDVLRTLLWPPHVPLPSLGDTTGDESNADDTGSTLVRAPLPDRFDYVYDPRHMLCLSCLEEVFMHKFWSWWGVYRRLPPVSAPDQPDCWYGLDCTTQIQPDHAAKYNMSS